MSSLLTDPDGRPNLNIGMLGYGFMGRAHVNAYRTIPYMFWPAGTRPNLHMIVGRSEDAVSAAATRYGFERHSTDWQDLISSSEVTIFDNVGPDNVHFESTMAAISAGKHVICEKPLSWFSAEAVALADAAEKAGVKSLTCFKYRFVPAVRLARDLIRNGELGEIFTSSFRYAQEWRTDSKANLPTSSGALNVIGCHAVDLAHFLLGDIADVSGLLSNPVTPMEKAEPVDTVTSVVRYGAGSVGTISATLIAPGRRNHLSFEINGSKGSITWDLENLNSLFYFKRDGSRINGFTEELVCESHHPLVSSWWPSGHVLGWEHSHINMLNHFLNSIVNDQGKESDAATFRDGARAAEFGKALVDSMNTGERTQVIYS